MAESDVEDALLDRLQEFLLELGHGFCFSRYQVELPSRAKLEKFIEAQLREKDHG